MTRSRKVIFSVGFLVAAVGLAGFAVFLRGQGLSRADSWVTVVGFFVSAVLGLASAWFGFLAWRHPVSGGPAGPAGVTVSGDRSVGVAHGSTVVTGDGNVVGDHSRGRSPR